MKIADILSGGDLRSKGRSEEVVTSGLTDKRVFLETLDCLFVPDLLIQTRAADAIEKITREKPDWLSEVKKRVLPQLRQFEGTKILQMHIAMLLGRMNLTQAQKEKVLPILENWAVNDRYTFTKVAAMQAYFDLCKEDTLLRKKAIVLVKTMMQNGSAAITSRGRRLLNE